MKVQNQLYGEPTQAKWETTEDGFLRCKARVLRVGVMPYRRDELPDVPEGVGNGESLLMMVPSAALSEADAMRSLEGASVVIGGHQWITPENIQEVAGGHTAGAARCDGSDLEIDLVITDPEAIQKVRAGELSEISAAYYGEAIYEPGEWRGKPFDARQVRLRYNHIAVLPAGQGRGGREVKILNQKKGIDDMPVKVKLANTGRFVNTDEEGASAIEGESEANSRSLEASMNELADKNSAMEGLQKEIESLKGELQVYKDKLDELLKDEVVESKAMEMMADQDEAGEIIENCSMKNESGKPMDEKEKTEFRNSLRKLHGDTLYSRVLQASGVNIKDMSPEARRGAFRAQNQLVKSLTKTVSGGRVSGTMTIQNSDGGVKPVRTPLERLGFRKESK